MPKPLFVFVQMDFPWAIGPADGRYLLRARAGGDPERVLVLQTLKEAAATGSRITLVDPVSLPAEHQARAWLEDVERDRRTAIEEALSVLNRVVYLHRIAAADPYTNELSATQALAIRAGWGTGDELAAGRYTHADELPAGQRAGARRGLLRLGGRRARTAELLGQERLASLLGAHVPTLLSEELALRARLDLDQGRLALAALDLSSAMSVAAQELRRERREDLALRIDELDQLRAGVEEQARAAIAFAAAESAAANAPPPAASEPAWPERESLEHALERLEAALRARSRTGERGRRAG
jgi:hypothetical protein